MITKSGDREIEVETVTTSKVVYRREDLEIRRTNLKNMMDSILSSHQAELDTLDGYLVECDKLGIMTTEEKVA